MQNDNDTGAFAVIILICLIFFLLITYNHKILAMWHFVMVPVSQIVAWIASTDLGAQLVVALDRDPVKLAKVSKAVAAMDPAALKKLDYSGARKVGDYVHRITTLLLGPLLIVLGFKLNKHSSMDSDVYGIYKGVPQIAKVLSNHAGREWLKEVRDLTKEPLYEGSLNQQAPITPWRFAELYGLAKVDDQRRLIEFDRDKAITAYEKTLGRKFTTLDALAAGPIGEAWNRIITQLPPNERDGAAQFAIRGHLYEKTILIALVNVMSKTMIVEQASVQPVLRYKDLAMFDALSSTGRRTAYAAGAAIMSQYRYEVATYNATTTRGRLQPEEGVGARWAASDLEEALTTDPYERPWAESKDIWANLEATS